MQYVYGQHQWHSEYQKLCKKRDIESLRYVLWDCRVAMTANPQNPKCGQYADEAHYCAMEITKRKSQGSE
jgi:hypothetical protein